MSPRPFIGISSHRLKDNPQEKRFAVAWRNICKSTLPYLLEERPAHRGYPPAVSDRDHVVAATIIQWLGSPVGQAFLADLGYVKRPKRRDDDT